MKSIYFQKLGEKNALTTNLIYCLQLDPSLEQIKIKLHKVCEILILIFIFKIKF